MSTPSQPAADKAAPAKLEILQRYWLKSTDHTVITLRGDVVDEAVAAINNSAAVEGLMAVIAELAVSTFPFGTKCWCRAVDACENQKQCVNARADLAAVEQKGKV